MPNIFKILFIYFNDCLFTVLIEWRVLTEAGVSTERSSISSTVEYSTYHSSSFSVALALRNSFTEGATIQLLHD